MIVRDLMVGSEALKEMGYLEEAEGHNARLPDSRPAPVDGPFPQRRLYGSILNSSFDWNGIRQPYIVATEMTV